MPPLILASTSLYRRELLARLESPAAQLAGCGRIRAAMHPKEAILFVGNGSLKKFYF